MDYKEKNEEDMQSKEYVIGIDLAKGEDCIVYMPHNLKDNAIIS